MGSIFRALGATSSVRRSEERISGSRLYLRGMQSGSQEFSISPTEFMSIILNVILRWDPKEISLIFHSKVAVSCIKVTK